MGVRVAYGQRKNINSAIEKGTIPKGSIIITKGEADSEMLFYDPTGNLKTVAERTRFKSLKEAEQWVKDYPCKGFILVIHNGAEWLPYIVNDDNSLSPLNSGGAGNVKLSEIEQDGVLILDGGNAVF